MKRTITLFLAGILLAGFLLAPVSVNAATATSKAGAVTTKEGPLNVRAKASSSSAIVTTLKKGSYITLISKSGSWWKVEYGQNKYGYCHSDYVTTVQGTPAVVATQSGPLNVRSGAGTSYSKVATLPKGLWVLRLTTTNGWSRILYHGVKTGYVSSQYLSDGNVNSGVISLKMPSFKQYDSRWANVKIGSSGKTISQIGCATTAIAMMESYRTSTTIYPDAMSKKLKYTSSGSVYWPTNYTTVTSSSDYLNRIYQQLMQGKPVLFGAKNSYGGQHWVVINGFSGGSMTTANFTILDPGSESRNTLQKFLSAYPTFYKYFYY